jgi:hypothetical protein
MTFWMFGFPYLQWSDKKGLVFGLSVIYVDIQLMNVEKKISPDRRTDGRTNERTESGFIR